MPFGLLVPFLAPSKLFVLYHGVDIILSELAPRRGASPSTEELVTEQQGVTNLLEAPRTSYVLLPSNECHVHSAPKLEIYCASTNCNAQQEQPDCR